jgi:hypothetical protein
MASPAKSAKPAAASAPEPAPRKPSKLRWLIGWVLVPLTLMAALFGVGVHVGARHPTMWLARGLLWMTGSEAQVGPAGDQVDLGMATRMRTAVLPSMDYALRVSLDDDDLRGLAKQMGVTPETIDCATACRALWKKEQPEREFLQATRCVVTESKDGKTGKLECDAKVQK